MGPDSGNRTAISFQSGWCLGRVNSHLLSERASGHIEVAIDTDASSRRCQMAVCQSLFGRSSRVSMGAGKGRRGAPEDRQEVSSHSALARKGGSWRHLAALEPS